MATADSLDSRLAHMPLRRRLASAVGCALVLSAVGHTATPLLKAVVDSALQRLSDWNSGRLNDLMSAPSNLSTILSGFTLWILQIPFVLLLAAFALLLGLVALAFTLLDQAYGFAVIGLIVGLQPGGHRHPFARLADRLGWIGGLLGVSAVQALSSSSQADSGRSGFRIPKERVLRKLWGRCHMSRDEDLEELETEVLHHVPADVMHALQRSDRQESLLKHLARSSITRFVSDIDKRTLEVLTAKILVGTAAVKAATEAKRAVRELSRVKGELDQAGELQNLRHETARMMEQDKQERLRLRVVRRQRAAATLKAQSEWLEREIGGKDSPRPTATGKWEALLLAFKGDITGIADFQAQTDLWLAEYRERQRAAVEEDDPRRAEKLARISSAVDALRELRDRMLRESWEVS